MQQIRLLLTPFQRETRTLHQSWYTCIKFVILTHDESKVNPYWIHNESIMNPRSMPFTTLLWCRPLRSSALPVDVGRCWCEDCEALRKQTRWQRPLSIADSMKQKQVGWVEWTEPNWTDEWIDGLMLTLMEFFFSHRKVSLKTPRF